MNGLSLRICSGADKTKDIMSLPPVVVTNFPTDNACALVKTFLQATTATDQLTILKQMLDKGKEPVDQNIIRLLVVVFFHSEAKHPVKCFVTRHITKSKHLQEAFIDLLTLEIVSHIKCKMDIYDSSSYKTFRDVVSKVAMCIENFSAGTSSVKNVGSELAEYLAYCLLYCNNTLRNCYEMPPTEKNEIYSLIHLTLRLLLHILTKNQPEHDDRESYWDLFDKLEYRFGVHKVINSLMLDKDVPMDTKTVCGIVTLSLAHQGWLYFINRPESEAMKDEYVQLAMYSAIITTEPMHSLQQKLSVDGNPPAITFILQKFMDIVERCSSDGVLILGVSRALHQISKSLARLEPALGMQTVEQLLAFVWAHLEHYMDSVRHLAAQTLSGVFKYCALLETTGVDDSGLERVVAALGALGVERRGFHAGVRGATAALGAVRLLAAVPLCTLLPALRIDSVAAACTATLDTLLQKHCQETEASVIHEEWVLPILRFVQTNDLEPEVLTILDNLLAKAVKLDSRLHTYILPHVKLACESPDRDLKNVMVLLSVARTSLADKLTQTDDLWRGIITYDVLDEAVVEAREEIRLQCLALVCGGRGGGAGGRAARGERALVLRYLAHNINEQDPHCRQRAIAMLKKFIKRELVWSGDADATRTRRAFAEELRALCYCSLQPAANYSRRCTALQLLHTIEPLFLTDKIWKSEYVDKLLIHLDDSYETNKALALDILQHVPLELLKETQSASVKLEDIMRQVCLPNPSECVSAAYKLQLLWRRLPEHILQGRPCTAKEPALFTLLKELIKTCNYVDPTVRHQGHWEDTSYDILRAPRDRTTYGPLHCIVHLLDRLHPESITEDSEWRELFASIIDTCRVMIAQAGAVVNHAAPEGFVPADCQFSDYGNNAGVRLEDGREVTAQMVLLCAWRTVKEACGCVGAVGGVAPPSALPEHKLRAAAELLADTVLRARHRGAFEQAYLAYERVLHRMWRDPRERVRAWPQRRLASHLAWLRGGGLWAHTADRRSAGLPLLIQAVVSTEIGAGGPGTGLRDVITELLLRAEREGQADSRAHACNVLRSLYRATSLDMAVQSYVGEGLRVALKGFDGATWVERNSSTLLLSALMTRVFGVSRARTEISARNRMTGRVFYLRYPHLYDIMLNKLKEVSESEDKRLLCPSLYPVLLLLARLYPSSLEGTESNLKLGMFVPYVVACARSRVLMTRRLAAAAAVSLIPPTRYVAHLEYLMGLISDARVERNFCHGILLQLCALLENKPSGVECGLSVPGSLWVLEHGPVPCYPVLHEHVRYIALLISRFPETVSSETLNCVEAQLREIVFKSRPSGAACGRELCLSECLRTLLVLLRTRGAADDIADLVVEALAHPVHEVCDAALDYVLSLRGRAPSHTTGRETTVEDDPQSYTANDTLKVLGLLRARPQYLSRLAAPLRDPKLWKCDPQRAHKYLEVLVAEGDTQKLVVGAPPPFCFSNRRGIDDDIMIMYTLKDFIIECPETTIHLYLESMTSYWWRCIERSACARPLSLCLRVCSHSSMPRAARAAAAAALRRLAAPLLALPATPTCGLSDDVELNVFMGVATLLQDEERSLRALAAHAALACAGQSGRSVVASVAAEWLLAGAEQRPRPVRVLTALALAPCLALPGPAPHADRERQVFEPIEKWNVHSEEALWSCACAARIIALCARESADPAARAAPYIRELYRMPRSDDPILQQFLRKLNREI